MEAISEMVDRATRKNLKRIQKEINRLKKELMKTGYWGKDMEAHNRLRATNPKKPEDWTEGWNLRLLKANPHDPLKRSKFIFLLIAMLFLMIIMYFVYDFSRKTTFPGSPEKKNNIEPSENRI